MAEDYALRGKGLSQQLYQEQLTTWRAAKDRNPSDLAFLC